MRLRGVGLIVALGMGMVFPAGRAWGQGSLTPPGGPGPTMKTLDQIEPRTPIESLPFTIDESGSYFLTGPLTGTKDSNGITITADNVVLDLRGFEVIGVTDSRIGIHIPDSRNVAIRNGIVRSWGWYGIKAWEDTDVSYGCVYEDLHLYANGLASGAFSGLDGGASSLAVRCVARANSGIGIRATSILDCVSTDNGEGFSVNSAGTISRSVARTNGAGPGITAAAGVTVSDCSSAGNSGDGINGGLSVTVSGCTVTSNGGDGIDLSAGALLTDCTVNSNQGHGIEVDAESVVRGNVCAGNGVFGIRIVAEGSRVEGNHVTLNSSGIVVEDVGNVVVKNSARSNPPSGASRNYQLVAGTAAGALTSNLSLAGPWDNVSF